MKLAEVTKKEKFLRTLKNPRLQVFRAKVSRVRKLLRDKKYTMSPPRYKMGFQNTIPCVEFEVYAPTPNFSSTENLLIEANTIAENNLKGYFVMGEVDEMTPGKKYLSMQIWGVDENGRTI